MKLPPCNSQLRSHSRTGHDSASGVTGVKFDSWVQKRRSGKPPQRTDIPPLSARTDVGNQSTPFAIRVESRNSRGGVRPS